MIKNVFTVLCSGDLQASREFYAAVLGLDTIFESGWYTTMACPDDRSRQLAFVQAGHESVPAAFGVPAAGVLVTVEVDDVDAVHAHALAAGVEIVQALRDEAFGQRHFMVRDPNDVVLDVVEPIPPAPGFLREAATWRRAQRAAARQAGTKR
jgi:catechol 2,3-dioxygenase-like lactoylglutathione lyase family enzyme